MAVVNTIADLAAWLGWYVVPFILILSLIVSIHELGHYLVGRWCGVKIDAFSLGFGPELWARVDSRGTRWRIGALPLGGYVKFHGDANVASVADGAAADPSVDRSMTLAGQPLRNRAAIVARRAGRQFSPGLRDFYRNVHGLWPGRAHGPDRAGRGEQSGGGGRVSGRRRRQVDQRATNRKL